MDPQQANLQTNLLLNSHFHFNPTPTFLGVIFDGTLSFSKHVSLMKAKSFHVSRPYTVSLLPHGAPLRSPSLFCIKLFFGPFSLMLHRWFPFLSATNITKLESLHQAASCAISGCPSASPIPLLLFEASLLPLRVTLTHFTLLSYEWAFRLPIFYPISGLARLGVKPRLFRSSWRAFASTHLLMLPFTSPKEALLACPPSPFWSLCFFNVESTLSSPCSRSDLFLFFQGAAFVYLDSLSL